MVWSHFAWLRTQPHRFWWWSHQDQWDTQLEDEIFGRAQDFVLTGRQDCRGTDCYVLECKPDGGRFRRWFVGIKDSLLRGQVQYNLGYPSNEYWMEDYREVGPGWRFPMTQGFTLFDSRSEEGPLPSVVVGHLEVLIEQILVDQPLSDDLFRIEFKEGVMVIDERFGGQVTYPYKKDRTEAEWDQIRQKAARNPIPRNGPQDGTCRSCRPS